MMMRSPIQTAGDLLETRRSAIACLRAQAGWTIRRCGHTRSSVLLALVITVPLSGCLVGPNYTRPKVNAPTVFRGAEGAAQQASFADLPWWEIFKDDTLKGLVQTALANNYDMRVATARVEQARQLAAQAHAQFYPAVGYSAGISGGKNEFLGNVAPNGGNTQGAFLAAVSAAWEVDLWGRIRRLNEAARARYLSTEEARRGVMLSLASDTAQAYFELLGLELQLEIARQNADTFTQILKLFTQRLEGGVASKLDTSRAAAALATVTAAIPELERQIAIKENQINILLGQNPAGIPHSTRLLEEIIPPDIPVGLPSALLERRPDVLSAEEDVRAANALIGLATAAFFPQIGLTTFLGHASTPLEDFASGKANAWSFAGNIAGPIYQGGALKARKREAIANWDEARLRYEQVALFAFQDVSNTLISHGKYESILAEQTQAVRSYEEAVRVALLRYNNGKASYFEVLDAQQQLYPAQNAAALTELNRRLVIIQLYRALGGGWNLNDAQWMGTQPVTAPQQPPAKQNP